MHTNSSSYILIAPSLSLPLFLPLSLSLAVCACACARACAYVYNSCVVLPARRTHPHHFKHDSDFTNHCAYPFALHKN